MIIEQNENSVKHLDLSFLRECLGVDSITREMISMRFGIHDGQQRSLTDVAAKHNLTRQEAKKRIDRGLERLDAVYVMPVRTKELVEIPRGPEPPLFPPSLF